MNPYPDSARIVVLSCVSFIADLRPQLGAYNISIGGGQKMLTPNIDKLAARGLTFRNCYNQVRPLTEIAR